MTSCGSPRTFAIGFELRVDPDRTVTYPGDASWGALEIWVGNRCLTRGVAPDGTALQSVETSLLPILRWVIEAWDLLFHEERLPLKPARDEFTSMAWYLGSVHDPRNDADFLDFLELRETWWGRHALGSAAPGFRIPDVHFRRYGQKVEISWSDAEWRDCGEGVQMLEVPGAALLDLEAVTSALAGWCSALLGELEGAGAGVGSLREQFEDLQSPHRQIARLEIAAKGWIEHAARAIRERAGVTEGSVEDTVRSLLGAKSPGRGYYEIFPVPVLLYRSADPQLSSADVQQLLDLCSGGVPPGKSRLTDFQDPAAPPSLRQEITADGYERARQFRERFGVPPDAPLTQEADLETVILPALNVRVVDVLLQDRGTDGASVYARDIAPAIAVNRNGKSSRTRWGRRMTLAHELCHLLHDVEFGRAGVVSGPWAPAALERRANAFAAMLLAPEEVLAATLPRDVESWTATDLRNAMVRVGVGVQTLTWQLYNLRWISASERYAWVDELAQ